MADPEHLDILKQGAEVWNKWRQENPDVRPDLSNMGIAESRFAIDGANINLVTHVPTNNFQMTNLRGADLSHAILTGVLFSGADLSSTNLREANLMATNLVGADLRHANLNKSKVVGTYFRNTNLEGADFSQAMMILAVFAEVDLSVARGLDAVDHRGPSTIGVDTIYRSKGNIPEAFLRGAGLDDIFITYIRSLVGKPIDYYSCFISYSSKNEAFAKRLYADLQNNNVRCWFAPEDLKIGDKFRHHIDESIRVYDKLLLVLSEASLASTWVSYEVEKALDKEPEGKPNVLFPIRLDKAILTCETDWAKDIRKSRHIGDFEHWKDHDAYQVAFKRLLRDLKAQS